MSDKEIVKPVSGATTKVEQPKPVKREPQKVVIGNVSFRKEDIDETKTKVTYENGKKMNTVFVKPGVTIKYPDQQAGQGARVESLGLSPNWWTPDTSHINVYDLNNATIIGNPNQRDHIDIWGNSSNNQIFVNQKDSFYIIGDMRRDYIELGANTKNNKVYMDEKDQNLIFYNDKFDTDTGLGIVEVGGEGMSSQEHQLKASLSQQEYNYHKEEQSK